MAVLEQLVFGFRADGEARRQILGYSPGLVGDCAREVVKLCEGWGAVPDAGLRRSVLMSFPLMSRISGMLGELHAVIRIAPGVKPIYHAMVLTRADYQEFDLNPYILDLQGVFLSSWSGDHQLALLDLSPAHDGSMVSPPIGSQDIGSVDEAVRQMLVNRRLLLPLEQSSRDSDRFLALTIACLPRVLRLDLRFSSWAPSGANSYTLAATYSESALFSTWQPYLMTAVLDDLHPACKQYLSGLKDVLAAGDVDGLKQHSDSFPIELGRPIRTVGRKPGDVVAVVDQQDTTSDQIRSDSRRQGLWSRRSETTPGRPRSFRLIGQEERPRRPPRRYRIQETGRFRRNLAVALSLSILVIGAMHLWNPGIPSLLHRDQMADLYLDVVSDRYPVDVATLYDRLITPKSRAGQGGLSALGNNPRQFGLEQLSQAGKLLVAQGRDYLKEADRTLIGSVPAESWTTTKIGHEPAETQGQGAREAMHPIPAEVLIPRGMALVRQLRLLPLAVVSLREDMMWRDLNRLSDERLKARFDSLLVRGRVRSSSDPSLGEIQQLLSGIDLRSRHLRAVDSLERLLEQDHRDPGWERRAEATASMLADLRHGRARQLRDDALLLVRVKRAEQAAIIADQAFSADYGPWSVLVQEIHDLVPELSARMQSGRPRFDPPALLSATADFYETMSWAADPDISGERLAVACRKLAQNRSVAFDPDVYGDHLARLRFRWMTRLLVGGVPVAGLPSESFGGGAVLEHVAFLEMIATTEDSTEWKSHSRILTDPFLVRWARHKAKRAALIPSSD